MLVRKAWGRTLSGQCGDPCLRSAWSTGLWSHVIPTRPEPQAKTTACEPASRPRAQPDPTTHPGQLPRGRWPRAASSSSWGWVPLGGWNPACCPRQRSCWLSGQGDSWSQLGTEVAATYRTDTQAKAPPPAPITAQSR